MPKPFRLGGKESMALSNRINMRGGGNKEKRRYIVKDGVQQEAFNTASGSPTYGSSGGYFTVRATVSTHVRTNANVDGSEYTKCVLVGYSNNLNNAAFFCKGQSEVTIPLTEAQIASPTDPSSVTNYAELGLYDATIFIKDMYFE